MPSFRSGTVTAVVSERRGLQRVEVDGRPAYVLTDVIGPVEVGHRVVMNTTAVDLGLGTGGSHVVHWNLSRDEWSAPPAGREMKVRYTSVQVDVDVPPADEIADVPVVACVLHSQVAAVALAYADRAPRSNLAYVMTDGGALPLVLSDLVYELRERDLLTATVTAGHAFGGDVEAITLEHALALATSSLGADAVVVGPGPGVLGVGSALAFSSRDVAHALDAALRPILALRVSEADARDRHRGISHHSQAVLDAVRAPVTVPVPADTPTLDLGRHTVVAVDVPDIALALKTLGVTSMGRAADEDPVYWAYAGAAGAFAAQPSP